MPTAVGSPNYVTGNYKVKSVSYSPSSDPTSCCKDIAAPPGSLSEWMCHALCVLCCMEIHIELDLGSGARDDPTPADDRDFPSVSPGPSGELSFTMSQYGKFIPIVFGSDKLDGNVFWSTPIEEHVVGDVAAGEAVFYRTISFAFGICEGEINGLLRLWMGDRLIWDRTANVDDNGIVQPNADGFLLGATVDLTEEDSPLRGIGDIDRATKISVFSGSETQLPEGVMVEEEGYENVPAYRGLAYILFENFVLGSSSAVPALFAEVTSNTQNLHPRVYGNLATPTDKFDEMYRGLFYDPTHNHFIVPSRDQTPNPDNYGLAIFDGNNLEESSPQQELQARHGFTSTNMRFEYLQVLTSSFVAIPSDSGNQGFLRVFNPFTGDLLDAIGPGGGLSGHSLTTGFAPLADSATFVAPAHLGVPGDIFVGLGLVNSSIGFAYIDENGQIFMRSTLNSVLPHSDARILYSVVTEDFRVNNVPATFAFDSLPAAGLHVYAVSGSSSETVEFHVSRITCNDIMAPVYTEIAQISCGDIAGDGIAHTLLYMFMDPVDNCIVMCIAVGSGRSDRIVKWSPFTGAIVWNKTVPVDFLGGARQAGPNCFLMEQKYAWLDGNVGCHEIDLKTGSITTLIESLADNNLPSPNTAYQFYNGYEDAIVYRSAEADQQLVKVYLNRITRSTVELGDIVSNLLGRVGMLPSDIVKTDLQALTLNGYTIMKQQSLRTCFGELGQAFKYDLIESNGRIKYKTRGDATSLTIPKRRLGDINDDGWLQIEKQNDISRIRKINLTYRDIDREYADNVQSFILPKYGSQQFDNDAAIDVTVPIVLEADNAKVLAEILLYSKLVYDTNVKGKIPGYYANLDPADVVTLELDDEGDDTLDVRLRKVEKGNDHSIEFEASVEDRDIYIDQVNLFGSIGRFEKGEIAPIDFRLDGMLVQIPYIDEADAEDTNVYKLFVTMLPFKASAEIPESITVIFNGTQRIALDPPLNFPTWGFVTEAPLATRAHFSKDMKSTMRVRIVSDSGAVLQSVTNYIDMLNDGKVNLAYVGGELIQFQTVTDEGDGYYLITGLHRGRYGTEMFCETQSVGARFILLAGTDGIRDTSIMTADVSPLGESPRKVAQVFFKTNNPFQPTPVVLWNGLNLRPWTVADMRTAYDGEDAEITWQRRTRFNGQWINDGLAVPNSENVPLNETEERYQVFLFTNPPTFFPSDPATYLRRVEVTSPSFTYTEAMQDEDGFDNTLTTLYVMVNQVVGTDQARQGAARQQSLAPKE